VRVPEGVEEVGVRTALRERFNIEIGAGIGPLAGRIWRVGLMGASSTPAAMLVFLGALEHVLVGRGFAVTPGSGTAAALRVLGSA
jgi:alanine-glyoxylate transaminase/serine-glyoxylate transaminase/serine-pyruvate transaminase